MTPEEFSILYNDEGIFTYTNAGYTIRTEGGVKVIDWQEIQTMVAYKRDYMTTACICLNITCDNGFGFEISEEHSGWFQFLIHLKEAFPQINQTWEEDIIKPAFETKTTVIFEKQNRPLEEL